MRYRIGHGVDTHKLIKNETFILGGILFKSELGIAGHSDGDALLHALTDSILGALALGDIGTYFPSDNPSFKNKNSDFFLLDTINKMNSQNFKVNNTDITVMLQKPTVQPYINDIKKNLSKLLSIDLNQISIKATTTDHLGYIGRKEGIVVHAMTLLINELNDEN